MNGILKYSLLQVCLSYGVQIHLERNNLCYITAISDITQFCVQNHCLKHTVTLNGGFTIHVTMSETHTNANYYFLRAKYVAHCR